MNSYFFTYFWDDFGTQCWCTSEIGLRNGVVNKNGTKVFEENELPWKREYFITYSTDANFSSYSALHAELFIQEIIGDNNGHSLLVLKEIHKENI